MSAWRRHALQRLPQHRGRIDRAEGPADLWRGLLTIVLDSADNPSLDTSGASAVFRYAALCQSSASEDVRCAVREQFYPYALVGLRERLHLVLNESEWDKAEELMAPVLTPEELVTARQGFFRGLAQLDDQRPITTFRRIKDRIASAAPIPVQARVEHAWGIVVGMLEAGEGAIGLEIFVSNLSDIGAVIDPEARMSLEDLAERWGASIQ